MPKAEFTFGDAFQRSMLSLMLTDLNFTSKAVRFVPEERLYSESHKFLFKAILGKFEKEGSAPSYVEVEDMIKYAERHKRRMLKDFAEQIYETKVADAEFIKTQLTDYARKNFFIDIFQNGQTLWNAREHDKAYSFVMEGINELYGVSFNDDMAIGVEDFEDVRQRYVKKALAMDSKIPTTIDALDQLFNGGLEKGELGILLAEPKKGKSIGLIHMGCAALLSGAGKVAHFVLEGITEQTIMRYQARLAKIDYSRIAKDELTGDELRKLDMIGKRYMKNLELIPMNKHWNYTVLDVEAKLKELERRKLKPDLVVIDYGDLLKGHEKFENLRIEQAWVYRYLKQMAMMHDVAVWTASQAVRPKEDPDKQTTLRAKDISESYEKVRIADFVATLNQTSREKKLGILRFHMDIYRSNEDGRTVRLLTDFSKMIFHSKLYGTLGDGELSFQIPSWHSGKRKK